MIDFDWGARLQERKWELISGILGIILVIVNYYGVFDPKPQPVPWPGGLPDMMYSATPPLGAYRCQPGAPRPTWVSICWAGPESDQLYGCETEIVERQICAVRSCRPLSPPDERYVVTVGCLMEPRPKR